MALPPGASPRKDAKNHTLKVGDVTITALTDGSITFDPRILFPETPLEASEGAVNILYKRELAQAEDPDALRQEKVAEFRDKLANPYVAAERGYLDEVIVPRRTRAKLITALRSLETKRDSNPPKKHGNIPL